MQENDLPFILYSIVYFIQSSEKGKYQSSFESFYVCVQKRLKTNFLIKHLHDFLI